MEQTSNERESLLALLATKQNSRLVQKRSEQILELIKTHLGEQEAGLLALALAEAADKTLFAIFKRARDRQENFTGHLSKIHLA